jgi:cellobiose-specific phosphotransferase system component IIA
MFNLVEVQTALQSPSVQLADLMKYANGSSAEVPAYLALGELNRRKQLEATNTAFNATPPTVKDQLTNAPPAVNPTAAPTGIAPTATPPQLAATTAAPPRMNPAAAPANQVAPTAPAPSMMAAEGGLLSIPTPHMFHPESYATGGIVAFEEGGDVPFHGYVERPTFWDKVTGKAKDKQEKFDRQSKMLAADFSGDASDLELPANAPPHPYAIEAFLNSEQKAARRKAEGTDVNHPSPANPAEDKRQATLKAKAAQDAADKARHNALAAQVPTWHTGSDGTIKGTKPAEAPVDAAVAAPVAQAGVAALPRNKPVDDFNNIPAAGIPTAAPAAPAVLPPVTVERDARQDYKALTADERQAAIIKQAENDKILREKFGISDDPHKDTRERTDKLEAKRAAQEAEDPFNSLMARLAAFGSSKEQTFGGGMGDSAIAGDKYRKETQALRDKQATEMIAARQAMETAEDARKRGHLTEARAAEKEAETHAEKAEELRIHADTALAALQTAQTGETYHKGILDIATKKAPFENAHTAAETWRIKNPLATPEQAKDHHIKLIKEEYSRAHGGKKMSEVDALAAYSDAVNPSKGESIEQKRQAAYSALKVTNPNLTYQQYIAQFDTPPDSSKIQAGRAAMKP